MTISVRQSSVAVYEVMLKALLNNLDKAQAHAEAKKFDSAIYLTLRFRPDMFAFARQVQSACDHAKNSSSRLAGVEAPRFEDNEASLAELKARIEKTLAHIATLDDAALEAGADARNHYSARPEQGEDAWRQLSAAFRAAAILLPPDDRLRLLRYAGVEIGKRDFLGAVPGIQMV